MKLLHGPHEERGKSCNIAIIYLHHFKSLFLSPMTAENCAPNKRGDGEKKKSQVQVTSTLTICLQDKNQNISTGQRSNLPGDDVILLLAL